MISNILIKQKNVPCHRHTLTQQAVRFFFPMHAVLPASALNPDRGVFDLHAAEPAVLVMESAAKRGPFDQAVGFWADDEAIDEF